MIELYYNIILYIIIVTIIIYTQTVVSIRSKLSVESLGLE